MRQLHKMVKHTQTIFALLGSQGSGEVLYTLFTLDSGIDTPSLFLNRLSIFLKFFTQVSLIPWQLNLHKIIWVFLKKIEGQEQEQYIFGQLEDVLFLTCLYMFNVFVFDIVRYFCLHFYSDPVYFFCVPCCHIKIQRLPHPAMPS